LSLEKFNSYLPGNNFSAAGQRENSFGVDIAGERNNFHKKSSQQEFSILQF